jgi:glyoxylate reductase
VVDEAALAAALHSGALFAAGIDVYEREPLIDPQLLTAPRAVLLPHIGSASQATRTRMATMATSAVATVLAGGVPPNVVPA